MKYTPIKFYDILASDYDNMTEFDRRFKKERPFFQELVKRYNLKSALDAGCGTGLHSFLLSQMGLQVTAVDTSQKMLNHMREHAKELGLYIKIIRSSFIGLKKVVRKKFDSVFCLGNTLAHLLTKKELFNSLKTFYGLLSPEGVLIIQILNYDRILGKNERIQSIREIRDKTYIRFYDYENRNIRFNILCIEKQKNGTIYSLNSVQLHPWIESDIVCALHQTGFANVKLFGSIALDPFSKQSSKDLIVLAQK